MTRRADSEDQLKSRGAEGLLMASAFSGCYAEDIKKGERVLDECKAKTKVQMLQGKGPFGEVLCEEDDLFGEMLQNQMMQGKNLFGEVLCQEEERHLWDSMEDFILENPTPAYPTAFSPQPTPRCVELASTGLNDNSPHAILILWVLSQGW